MTDLHPASLGLGFQAAEICLFIWASIDYNRFIKFWICKPAPYSKLVKIIFRSFFLLCVLGGVWQVAANLHDARPPADLYLHAILPFLISLTVIVLMVQIVEVAGGRFIERRSTALKKRT